MRDTDLFFLLENTFPDGLLQYPVFFLDKNKANYIRLYNNPIIEMVITSDKVQKEITTCISNYLSEKELGMIMAINTTNDMSYIATDDTMKDVLLKLQSIENLSPTFEFDKRIFYNALLNFDTSGSLWATIDGKVHSLNTTKQIDDFNELQKNTTSEIVAVHKKLISVLQEGQFSYEYIKENHLLSINNSKYVCKVQFGADEWHGFFFNSWNSNHIIRDKFIQKTSSFMVDMARKYISIQAEKDKYQESK